GKRKKTTVIQKVTRKVCDVTLCSCVLLCGKKRNNHRGSQRHTEGLRYCCLLLRFSGIKKRTTVTQRVPRKVCDVTLCSCVLLCGKKRINHRGSQRHTEGLRCCCLLLRFSGEKEKKLQLSKKSHGKFAMLLCAPPCFSVVKKKE
ncbi:hypothetical protein DFO77_1251, partial [Marinilabilia salmonicolor]